ncbi:acetylglutamate kinase [Verrucomicrobia bacterium SCGC AG-212-E04]|nr:acetylglutamate kinase [Verrucomicrobia bacterium SCGC AG-212-E04]
MSLTAAVRIEALSEALPFIQKLQGQPLVIKYGGSAMEDEQGIERTLRDVAFLATVGLRPVIVHGGGKAITARLRDAGVKPVFVGGLRVTDAASMRLVAETLDGQVNGMIVAKLGATRCKAVGLSGRNFVLAKKAALVPTNDGNVDLGAVGDVEKVSLEGIHAALNRGEVPVMSPLGRDAAGQLLNVNADTVAGATAAALGAGRLVFISDVPGLMRDPKIADSLIPSLQSAQVAGLLKQGIIVGGMIPKVESALLALSRGVERVHLIDGRIPHALLIALFTPHGIGTEMLP